MVAGVRNLSATTTDPHVRQIDPWRDGRAVASLLESAFSAEMDDSGQRLVQSLRNYGMLDALSYGFGTGFVWVEEGLIIGNASIQRNHKRRNTWIIGNVATHTAYRNRGIGRAVVEACIKHAATHGARYVALQADAANPPALHLYEKIDFERLGEVAHYMRPPVRVEPVEVKANTPSPYRSAFIRKAGWSDRSAIWQLTQLNIPEKFTYAEPFDRHVYQLGLHWSFFNALNGNPEEWWVIESANNTTGLTGALRTRVNYDTPNHQLELLLGSEAATEDGIALLEQGLRRYDRYLSKPIYAAPTRSNAAVHAAMQLMGFQPTRTLVHMRLEIRDE